MIFARLIALCGFALCLAAPAWAEVDADAFSNCLKDQSGDQNAILRCLQVQHAPCDRYSADNAPSAALLCFTKAQSAWTSATKAHLDEIRATEPENVTAIANIHVKYSSLAGLLQCDRQEELALLGDLSSDQIQLQKTRCIATALGYTYASLLFRTRIGE